MTFTAFVAAASGRTAADLTCRFGAVDDIARHRGANYGPRP